MEDQSSDKSTQQKWFVLRVTYQRELMAKKVLDEMGIVNFLPMERVRRRTPQGKIVSIFQPAIHNYLFVYSEKKIVDDLKNFKLPYLRYVMITNDGVRTIQTVPEYQMKNFIAVAGNAEEQAAFLDLSSVDLHKGDKVRIIGGPFAGVEGIYQRISNSRTKRVVVVIDGVMAAATTSIPLSLVEKL